MRDEDKREFLSIANELIKLNCELYATDGTSKFLKDNGIKTIRVNKISEKSPNILDILRNREVSLLINTPTKANDAQRDGFKIRRTAIEYGVEVLTSLDTLKAIIKTQNLNIDEKELDIFDISRI